MSVPLSISGTTGPGEEPIACTLDAAGVATQGERWVQILADAAVERVETEDGLWLHFRAKSGVEQELRELVAVETECCSWASWTVDAEADQLVLRIRSRGDGVAVLHTMFSRASAASAGDCRGCL